MTFLFDIGRVLLDFDFDASLRRLIPAHVTDGLERLAKLDARKDAFEGGDIDMADYIAWALEELGSEASPEEFEDAWRRIFTQNLPMWEVVKQLSAKKHRLILFSNTNPIHFPWLYDAYPEFELFDAAILSYERKCIKPKPAIYQYALDEYQLDPTQTIYIDDLEKNIETGRQFGFHCWQYDMKDHVSFERWLSAFNL